MGFIVIIIIFFYFLLTNYDTRILLSASSKTEEVLDTDRDVQHAYLSCDGLSPQASMKLSWERTLASCRTGGSTAGCDPLLLLFPGACCAGLLAPAGCS